MVVAPVLVVVVVVGWESAVAARAVGKPVIGENVEIKVGDVDIDVVDFVVDVEAAIKKQYGEE